MGYHVEYEISRMCIPASNRDAALAAINHLHTDEMLLKWASGGAYGHGTENLPVPERKWYSWIPNPKGGKWETLEAALNAWEFEFEYSADGSVEFTYYSPGKRGNEDVFFRAIAPFLVPGAEIEARGEDGMLWRIVFENGVAKTERGRVVYG